MKKKNDTSWGRVAEWYDGMLEEEKSFQKNVILPNLTRVVDIKPGEQLLDLACGTGYFSRHFSALGAQVTGVDIGRELIALAKKESPEEIAYHVSSADDLHFLPSHSIDKIICVLALQNIENVGGVLTEARRVLKKQGSLFLVLNHPAFRIPKESDWGFDEEKNIQFRRVDAYLSEKKVKIDMHPGKNRSEKTISFHRSLQYFGKQFCKAGFGIARLEEWISHRQGPKGKRFAASERARKEIPLFLFLELRLFVE